MATLEEVVENWKRDAVPDPAKLDKELFKTPFLHAKYLEYYVAFKVRLTQAEDKYRRMTNVKRRYFRGEFTQDELQQRGWEQWQGLKASGSELNMLLESDSDMCDLAAKVSNNKTAVATLEYIMKQIQSRDYTLKNYLDYNRYVSGG